MLRLIQQIALGIWGIAPGNYSGITEVAPSTYAIVDDKEMTDGFKLLTLTFDLTTGKVSDAVLSEPAGMALRRADRTGVYRDCEGVAFFPGANTVFVSGEEDQRIVEYALDGRPTGRELTIPESLDREHIATNFGFEALTYNACQHRFWTTTESTLPADGLQASDDERDVENLLRFVAFDDALKPVASYVYKMDRLTAKHTKGFSSIGVPSLVALDDGSLLVMEREAYLRSIGFGSFCNIKIFRVHPDTTPQVLLSTPMGEVAPDRFLQKELVGSFRTKLSPGKLNFGNYEGMCLGPRLADGRQTLLFIADAQNGYGNRFYRLKDYLRIYTIE